MKKLITFIVSALMVGVMATAAMAQDAGPGGRGPGGPGQGGPGGPGGDRAKMRGKMKEIETKVLAQLKLTDAQKTKIKALNAKYDKQMADLQKSTADRETKMKKMRTMMESRKKEFMAILTPEQQKKFETLMKAEMDKLRKEREKQGGQKPAGSKPGGNKPTKPN